MPDTSRVLFLCARMPFPLDTGAKQRTFQLLKGLARHHAVTLATFAGKNDDPRPKEVACLCEELVVVRNPGIDERSPSVLLRSLAAARPYSIAKYDHPQLRDALRALRGRRTFALVHCDQLHMAQYLDVLAGIPTILDEHNIETQLWQRQTAAAGGLGRGLFAIQQQLMRRAEIATCERADAVITCSDEDCRWVLQHTAQRSVHVVPNGVDARAVTPELRAVVEANTLVFVGSLDWPPNADGMAHFHARLWPVLKRRVPGIRCTVVGRSPDARLLRAAGEDPSFGVTGRVEDVRPFIARAAVYVVPLYVGGGTRLKILEAFAMGKCVVSTALGAEGLSYSDGENILVAADDAHFIDRVVEALKDPVRAADIGMRARQLAVDRYDWEGITERFEAHAQALLGDRV